ncbi:MAG: response regulator [Clostridia bacterium]|nr:response regulator [Clostridia bacterium]
MLKVFQEKYFHKDLPMEVKVFNSSHIIINIGLFIAIILSLIFVPDTSLYLMLFGTLIMGGITFFEANRTGRYVSCAVVMSMVLNFILLPYAYFQYGGNTICIIIYSLLGLVYTVLLVPKKWGLILSFSELMVYVLLVCFWHFWMERTAITSPIKDSTGVLVAVIFTGILTGCAIKYKLEILKREQQQAEKMHVEAMDAYIAKDMFLINMSHEIRTPMNAILGTTELLLDLDISERVRENVYNILNSCNALLSITNDLLNMSKSDNGKMEIFATEYDVAEILSDIINMMSIRLMDSEVEFMVEIDPTIPSLLYGDGARIRQVFINILNNAVKYTKHGSITLRVGQEQISESKIRLTVDVQDTGIGIKEENLSQLFSIYNRVEEGDVDRRSIEGTGLGLSICKEILNMLDGNISVKSKYKVGSTFSFFIPQAVVTGVPLVSLSNIAKPMILVFEENEAYQNVLAEIMKSMGLHPDYAQNRVMFEELLIEKHYTHVFLAQNRYHEVNKFLDRQLTDEKLVIIADINQMVPLDKYGCILSRPLHCINVAAIFTNDKNKSIREVIKKGGFICPQANILVVDDNLTNLNVVKGLLKKYKANVITANSGMECLRIVEHEDVDLIFLDYMMPEMDGIDTLNKIREMDDSRIDHIHIVALTANVVSGAREMFLEAGFNDYVSKPIEIDKIERVLKTNLPRNLIKGKN